MAVYYNEAVVVWCYRNDNPSDDAPTVANLTAKDLDLQAKWEQKLTDVLQQNGIPLNRENRSRVLQLAIVSSGGSRIEQVRRGCRYFAHVRGLNLG